MHSFDKQRFTPGFKSLINLSLRVVLSLLIDTNYPSVQSQYHPPRCTCVPFSTQNIRCLERSGISGDGKRELVDMAGNVMRMVQAVDPSSPRYHLLFRPPREDATFAEKLKFVMPEMPQREFFITDTDQLIETLPEVAESVIAEWLTGGRSVDTRSTRVLYRGMQRAMDLGAAGGLSGVLVWHEDGSSSGVMWVRLR